MSHTQGPWVIRRTGTGKPYQIEAPNGQGITQWRGISRPASEEGEANAQLISSAPDLLESLDKMLDHFEGNVPLWLLEMAEGAIDKARGRK